MLISVTGFFRNAEAFDILKRKVFPRLLQQRGDDPIRVWVLGCSTGQEAYSIAMVFAEASEKAPRPRKLQVFATDLNDTLLDKARHGLYARNLTQEVTPERLRRFFVEEEGGYRVSKSLREMVVFARQNLINDPPFSRMLLRMTGSETYTAHDGLEAINAAATFRPDVVLMDIGLPKMNGYDAARRIREQPWGKQMMLVALTGWGQDDDRQRSREAGFDTHLVKPVDYLTLMPKNFFSARSRCVRCCSLLLHTHVACESCIRLADGAWIPPEKNNLFAPLNGWLLCLGNLR